MYGTRVSTAAAGTAMCQCLRPSMEMAAANTAKNKMSYAAYTFQGTNTLPKNWNA